jgi:predicted SAM-dependent methyltransferase
MTLSGCVDLTQDHCELFSNSVGICQIFEPYYVCDSSNRYQFQSLAKESKNILEIGPYSNPYYIGENVKYFDTMSREGIIYQIINEQDPGVRNHVAADDNTFNKVPHINYVDQNGDMSIIHESFDLIFSSHNIEHQVNLVLHLQQLENLLTNDGQIILFIPDKRFCFDHFVPESPLSDVLESYYNQDKLHPLRTVLAMICETTHNSAYHHLLGYHGQIAGKDVDCYQKALEKYQDSENNYINAHRWRFTPTQFAFIINSLNQLKLTNLTIEKLYLTKNNQLEFYVILKKQLKESE